MAPTGPVTRPLRRDAERNRELILEAAGAVFAEEGLSASFEEIARRAGVGVGTVYRRFPERDDLVDALFGERIDAMVDLAEGALALPDVWAGLAWFLECSVEAQAQDRGLKEVLGNGLRGHERLARARDDMKPVVDALVTRARDSGDLRADVSPLDLAVLGSMLSQISTLSAPQLWRRYLPLVLEGLRRRDTDSGTLPLPSPDESELALLVHGGGSSRALQRRSDR